jgi:hypothetical protein
MKMTLLTVLVSSLFTALIVASLIIEEALQGVV